jgi:hypothetical protein
MSSTKATSTEGARVASLTPSLFLEELRTLECAAGIAPLLPDGVASSSARIGYVLRRQRALRAMVAREAFDRLPVFWKAIFLLDANDAQRYCRRLGRRLWSEPERRLVPDAIRPILETNAACLDGRVERDIARGLVALTVLWTAEPEQLRPAAGLARSTIGTAMASFAVAGIERVDVVPMQEMALTLLHSLVADRSADAVLLSQGGGS